MSAQPASDAKRQLHNLFDSMSDERAQDILMMLQTEQGPQGRPFTEAEVARISRSLETSGDGDGVSTSRIREELGLSD